MADEPRPRRRRRWLVAAIFVALVAIAFVLGLVPRLRRRAAVRRDTEEMTIPTVAVVSPKRTAPTSTILLPGDVQADLDTPIFSRATGYLERWYVDIGTHVKKDQLLAQIAVPEIEQQLQQARGTLATAEANFQLAKITADRFTGLAATKAVSRQEVDNAVSAQRANEATVRANEATVRQLEQAIEFARIRAPFDGIISVRNVDVGDLINAGSSTTPRTELFHIVQAGILRVYVRVPEAYATSAAPGLTAEIAFTAFPGRTFPGKLVRTARAIDPTTRTLNTEIEVENSAGLLFAGAFASVRLGIPVRETFTLPVETLLFRRDGLRVATVVSDKIVLVPITPGRDFGETIEVIAGLTGDELVVDNPSDSIANDQPVRVMRTPPPPGKPVSQR